MNNFRKTTLENEEVKVVILPEVGGKIIEIYNKRTDTQFLLGPQNSEKTYVKPHYGARYQNYDVSGFDECFPTIAESEYSPLLNPHIKSEMIFPDHGELWSKPWNSLADTKTVLLNVRGEQFDYEFTKHITLADNTVRINYKLENFSDIPFLYLWSAHPLLTVYPNSQIILPGDVEEVSLYYSSDAALGSYGDKLNWPSLNGSKGVDNYSIVPDKKRDLAIKLFTDKLASSYGGIYHPDKDESILFTSNAESTPYIGLWLCYGGWPEESEEKHYTVAIEPTTSPTDSLKDALINENYSEVPPKSVKEWTMEVSVFTGMPVIPENINVNNSYE